MKRSRAVRSSAASGKVSTYGPPTSGGGGGSRGKLFLGILIVFLLACYSSMSWIGSIFSSTQKEKDQEDSHTSSLSLAAVTSEESGETSHRIHAPIDPIPLSPTTTNTSSAVEYYDAAAQKKKKEEELELNRIAELESKAQKQPEQNKNLKIVNGVPTFENKDNVSVSIIVVASHQRSSSTYLSDEILGEMPCHLTLNEIFFPDPKQSGDAWSTVGEELGIKKVNRKLSDKEMGQQRNYLAAFVLEVARRRCRQKLLQQDTSSGQCRNHCWVNYKHFPIHTPTPELIWDGIIQQNNLNHHKNPSAYFAMIILERNVHDRYRSKVFAKQTGDWNVKGSQHHKEKVANFTVSEDTEKAVKFQKEHKWWFNKVREYANGTLTPLDVPVVELTFDAITNRSTSLNKTQKELRDVLLARYLLVVGAGLNSTGV
mmetsp:Transcript_27837/g.48131  ORF Transcript_27837/g.48131 Transcript_27837/m.48131 type:complete len:428 (+) Transcript_27837:151-1434(+)